MKVYIGPYTNWIGPYQIAEKICFWVKKYDDEYHHTRAYDRVHEFGRWLSEDKHGNDSFLLKLCNWIHSFKKRKVKVKLHNYDSWNVDGTLSIVILPLLKQLKETKHGSGYIDFEDVPEDMRFTETEEYDAQSCFEFYNDPTSTQKLKCDIHTRYEWALDEMIWAFEQLVDDNWEDQYWIEAPELDLKDYPEDEGKLAVPIRWSKEGSCDWVGRQKHQERIDNGLRLFGKYYQTLWD